jgi:hypothetical protein
MTRNPGVGRAGADLRFGIQPRFLERRFGSVTAGIMVSRVVLATNRYVRGDTLSGGRSAIACGPA